MKRDEARHKVDADKLFENLLTADELLAQVETWLKCSFSKNRVYRWVAEGMPSEKIRGRLYFPRDEVALWLKRTANR